MLALVMAGGRGTRLQMGEKGLVRLCGKPLIEYVLNALDETGLESIVVTTPKTPYTKNYCRACGVDQICTEGSGYIEDISEAVSILGEQGPILIICADIPGISASHLNSVLKQYEQEEKDACSVWVPERYILDRSGQVQYTQEVKGVTAVPAGVNILRGDKITIEQTEISILIDDPALTFNINNRHDLETAESFFSFRISREDLDTHVS